MDAVAAALDGAGLGHVAAHGRFRADNPFFSSLQLADGPLTVYDLEALRRAPTRLILSTCDSGLSAVRSGDELMGLAAAVFSLGARTLIASVVSISDAATRPLMLSLHAGVACRPATDRRTGTGASPCPRGGRRRVPGCVDGLRLLRRWLNPS